MRTIPLSLRFALCSLLASAALAPGVARAEETPVLVVVESADAYGNVGKIRAGIARGLGTPAISLIEAQGRPTVGTLQVAIARGGTRASIHYVPSDGVAYAVLINVAAEGRADRAGEWLVAPCVSAVRTSEQRRATAHASAELLDPWLRARTQRGPDSHRGARPVRRRSSPPRPRDRLRLLPRTRGARSVGRRGRRIPARASARALAAAPRSAAAADAFVHHERTHGGAMMKALGLTAVPDDELMVLFRLVHEGKLSFPLRRSELLLLRTPHLAEHGDVLLGLDEPGVRAVLVAVIAERRRAAR